VQREGAGDDVHQTGQDAYPRRQKCK
jgi:hypothetical protein